MDGCDPETVNASLIHNALADIMDDERCAVQDSSVFLPLPRVA